MPQKTVPLDLEPKKILLNNNTAKIKNSNPTILSAGSISKPSLRKDAVIFAPIEKSTLGTTQSTRRIGKTKKSFAFISAFLPENDFTAESQYSRIQSQLYQIH
ncbi:MAG: hypothetical protein ACLTG0_02250 [Oscillibacter sp.]